MGQDLVCWPCRTFVGHVRHKNAILPIPEKTLKLRVWLKRLLSGNLDILSKLFIHVHRWWRSPDHPDHHPASHPALVV